MASLNDTKICVNTISNEVMKTECLIAHKMVLIQVATNSIEQYSAVQYTTI